MGRYRPPAPKSSPYITPAGFRRLQEEEQALWKTRAEVTKALSAAAAEGDRSENAEYIYRKKQLREIDRRIRYLQKRLPDLRLVSEPPSDPEKVYFGAWVTLDNEAGAEQRFRIVGADELDPEHNWISLDSPLARALLGKGIDEEIRVTTPNGVDGYIITAIDYGSDSG